jgi:hypothetical protein
MLCGKMNYSLPLFEPQDVIFGEAAIYRLAQKGRSTFRGDLC